MGSTQPSEAVHSEVRRERGDEVEHPIRQPQLAIGAHRDIRDRQSGDRAPNRQFAPKDKSSRGNIPKLDTIGLCHCQAFTLACEAGDREGMSDWGGRESLQMVSQHSPGGLPPTEAM